MDDVDEDVRDKICALTERARDLREMAATTAGAKRARLLRLAESYEEEVARLGTLPKSPDASEA